MPGIAQPYWLLLPLVLIALVALSPKATLLPGAWSQLIAQPLHAFLGKGVVMLNPRRRVIAMLCLWMLLAGALAAVTLGHTQTQPIRNLQGRVIVLDMGDPVHSARQVSLARQLIGQTHGIPTAVVAVTSRAFVVVPFTTDGRHIDRYLQVLQPEVIPVEGHLPWRGIERAAALLADNEILAGQIVLFTGSSLPTDAIMTVAGVSRDVQSYIVVDEPLRPGWQNYASRIDARVLGVDRFEVIDEDLASRRQRVAANTGSIRQRRDLTPWFVTGCLLLWLLLFFRQEST